MHVEHRRPPIAALAGCRTPELGLHSTHSYCYGFAPRILRFALRASGFAAVQNCSRQFCHSRLVLSRSSIRRCHNPATVRIISGVIQCDRAISKDTACDCSHSCYSHKFLITNECHAFARQGPPVQIRPPRPFCSIAHRFAQDSPWTSPASAKAHGLPHVQLRNTEVRKSERFPLAFTLSRCISPAT